MRWGTGGEDYSIGSVSAKSSKKWIAIKTRFFLHSKLRQKVFWFKPFSCQQNSSEDMRSFNLIHDRIRTGAHESGKYESDSDEKIGGSDQHVAQRKDQKNVKRWI